MISFVIKEISLIKANLHTITIHNLVTHSCYPKMLTKNHINNKLNLAFVIRIDCQECAEKLGGLNKNSDLKGIGIIKKVGNIDSIVPLSA